MNTSSLIYKIIRSLIDWEENTTTRTVVPKMREDSFIALWKKVKNGRFHVIKAILETH